MPLRLLLLATMLGAIVGCGSTHWRDRLQSEDPLERIAGAKQAAEAKDPEAVPLLIDRLEDDDEAVRMYTIMALRRLEGTDLGYKYWSDEVDRARAAQRWREYLRAKRQQTNHQAPAEQPGNSQQ